MTSPATAPVLSFSTGHVLVGDALQRLRELPDASIDSVVTDPPYGMTDLPADKVATVVSAWLAGDRAAMPSGRGFMGKYWDAFVPPPALWDEVLRVLKPGGHVVAFASSRTIDLMTLSVRLAGFEVRDTLHWTYGSGFPKSLDVSKAIDKQREEDREPVRVVCRAVRSAMDTLGLKSRDLAPEFDCHPRLVDHWAARDTDSQPSLPTWEQWEQLRDRLAMGPGLDAEVWRLNGRKGTPGEAWDRREVTGTVEQWTYRTNYALTSRDGLRRDLPATPAAAQWSGWGTALKPSHEPIVLARKPLAGTVAATVLEHGTGALNIDASRVGTGGGTQRKQQGHPDRLSPQGAFTVGPGPEPTGAGRWPANTLLTHSAACGDVCAPGCPVGELDQQSGIRTSGKMRAGVQRANTSGWTGPMPSETGGETYGDTGGASRFFPQLGWDPDLDDLTPFLYAAKPGKKERDAGLEQLDEQEVIQFQTGNGYSGKASSISEGRDTRRRNTHPTVKPVAVMEWLLTLVTPPGGVALDPFLGSGTTAVAAIRRGFRWVGCEMTDDYLPIIEGRVAHAEALTEEQLRQGAEPDPQLW